jgi:putative chitinase
MLVFPITIQQLLQVMPRAAPVASEWMGPLEQAMAAFDITSLRRVSMWLANIAHESSELTELEENMNYRTPERLLKIFPRHFTDAVHAAKYIELGPEAIASRVYANRLGNGPEESGDGWRYRARGPGGLTFKSNYMACSRKLCDSEDVLLDHPEFLVMPEFGAASFGWFWDMAGCNAAADANDFDGVCDRINIGRKTLAVGDSNGYDSREEYLQRAVKALSPHY